jgi:hypothetical protein
MFIPLSCGFLPSSLPLQGGKWRRREVRDVRRGVFKCKTERGVGIRAEQMKDGVGACEKARWIGKYLDREESSGEDEHAGIASLGANREAESVLWTHRAKHGLQVDGCFHNIVFKHDHDAVRWHVHCPVLPRRRVISTSYSNTLLPRFNPTYGSPAIERWVQSRPRIHGFRWIPSQHQLRKFMCHCSNSRLQHRNWTIERHRFISDRRYTELRLQRMQHYWKHFQ